MLWLSCLLVLYFLLYGSIVRPNKRSSQHLYGQLPNKMRRSEKWWMDGRRAATGLLERKVRLLRYWRLAAASLLPPAMHEPRTDTQMASAQMFEKGGRRRS